MTSGAGRVDPDHLVGRGVDVRTKVARGTHGLIDTPRVTMVRPWEEARPDRNT